ncbi:RNA polymerase sigma factor [Methylosinus sp. LW4]|uniref:RNA polymerase sigma factor n=1 Tax=Methylosinus sp. LW4 TaxID=136993 RepID=UPI00037D3240|nr:RNA polymerase sigma factor [Methylosinus sp. LW4]
MADNAPPSLRVALARHGQSLLRFLTRRVGSQAAPDLAQEALLRVLRHGEHATILEPAALLQSTAANLARDFARRRRAEEKYRDYDQTLDEFASSAPAPDARLEAEELMDRLQAAVESLPSRCRQVFMMRRFENLHQEEIARRLGISRNMVEKHMRLAVRRLQETLD